jgi:hypothetical protein
MVAYEPKDALLTVRRGLVINRPVHKVIGQAHRDFIALHGLCKLNLGDDLSGLGARHHGRAPRELDMCHWNWFRRRCCGQRYGEKSGYKESASLHPIPRSNDQLYEMPICGKWPTTRMGVTHPPPQTQTSRPRLLPRVCEHLLGEDDRSVMHIALGYDSGDAVQVSHSHAQ